MIVLGFVGSSSHGNSFEFPGVRPVFWRIWNQYGRTCSNQWGTPKCECTDGLQNPCDAREKLTFLCQELFNLDLCYRTF